ncbi:CoaE Dephospho-CoA kinase [Candidatus Nanopelagicaceae bacterium]
MLIVGLTGGIGAGKSTVANMFAQLGALTIDADQLARQAIEPGSSGFDEVVAEFSAKILTDGDIDRQKLGKIVFKDADKRKRLEAIIHPRVQAALAAKIKSLSPGDILVYEIPLLVETGAADKFDYIITVESDIENRLFERGMDEDEAERRIAAQASQAQREAVADRVIVNDGDRAELFAECARIWESELNAPRQ